MHIFKIELSPEWHHTVHNILTCFWKNGFREKTYSFLHFLKVQTYIYAGLTDILGACHVLHCLVVDGFNIFEVGKSAQKISISHAIWYLWNEQAFLWINKVVEENPYIFVSEVCSMFDLSKEIVGKNASWRLNPYIFVSDVCSRFDLSKGIEGSNATWWLSPAKNTCMMDNHVMDPRD